MSAGPPRSEEPRHDRGFSFGDAAGHAGPRHRAGSELYLGIVLGALYVAAILVMRRRPVLFTDELDHYSQIALFLRGDFRVLTYYLTTIPGYHAAVAAIRQALGDTDGLRLFLVVDGRFQPQFQLREPNGSEIAVEANGLEICFDLASAARARGASIDWTKTPHGEGLAIHLPLAPAAVKPIDVQALKQRLDAGDITVIDVRPPQDRARAPFARAEILDSQSHARLAALPKDTPLAFLYHHGNSSRSAAEHFREHGFRDVYNVEGGIDAWSREIDPGVPRY